MTDARTWFTAADLAELKLPGLPHAKRKVNELASERRWGLRETQARPRPGRGGGFEYHVSLLPPASVAELVRRGIVTADVDPVPEPDAHAAGSYLAHLWASYERQSDKVKAEAQRRLQAIGDVEALEAAGFTRTAAVQSIGPKHGVSTATLWNWLRLIADVPAKDRLPRLAPERKGGGAETDIHPAAWSFFKSDYLRPERPTYATCYERAKAAATANGWGPLPHVKTLQRKLEREVDPRVIVSKRQGADALRNTVPAQQRTVADLHALQLVNIDGHRWDVFVKWPDGRIARPMMVAIQDVYSRKFLAWRIGETESAVQTRLAFADLFANWGIPEGCLLDNGRAFASKWITGGIANRFRFKVREEEPVGLLTSLGVKVHWATPYRGQSKPIERGFRDLCDAVAKHPAFSGAYTGNKVDAKPENYASNAIDLDVFIKVATAGIAAHNAKTGRRTEAARGRSFDEAFSESYARHPIGRATPEQLRMALLAADQVTADRRTGAISLYGNLYHAPELVRLAGGKVTVRFDPDDLHGEVHVYDAAGAFVATAQALERTGFLNVEGARTRARQDADLRKATRRKVELEGLITAQDLAALLPDDPEDTAPAIAPSVLRPRFGRGAAAARSAVPALETTHAIDRFMAAEERLLRLVE